jgi:putative sterol carrier protein
VTAFDPADFASVDPQRFAELVKATPKAEIEAALAGPHRGKILDEIFGRFPNQFRADRAGNTEAVIHWIIGGRDDGGADTYEVVIADGACVISPEPALDPKLSVNINAIEFFNLLSGSSNPMVMFMTGKLKAKGDLALAANLANLFDLPKG